MRLRQGSRQRRKCKPLRRRRQHSETEATGDKNATSDMQATKEIKTTAETEETRETEAKAETEAAPESGATNGGMGRGRDQHAEAKKVGGGKGD